MVAYNGTAGRKRYSSGPCGQTPDSGTSLALNAFLHKNQEDTIPGCGGDDANDKLPHGVFHAHAHDMAFLEQWIGEMLDLSRSKIGKSDGPPHGM